MENKAGKEHQEKNNEKTSEYAIRDWE